MASCSVGCLPCIWVLAKLLNEDPQVKAEPRSAVFRLANDSFEVRGVTVVKELDFSAGLTPIDIDNKPVELLLGSFKVNEGRLVALLTSWGDVLVIIVLLPPAFKSYLVSSHIVVRVE